MMTLIDDPMFFYTIAFVVFAVLAYRYGRKPLLGWVDGEIHKIKGELDQARHLREEAEALLVSYQKRQNEAIVECATIVQRAQEDAERIRSEAVASLKESLTRQEHIVTARIQAAEAEALAFVHARAVDLAVEAAEKILAQSNDSTQKSRLMEQALSEIPSIKELTSKAA